MMRAIDVMDVGMERLSEPVYFVAQDLKRRWPEIVGEEGTMNLRDVPPLRLHLIENIWIVSTYLRLKAAGLPVRITDRLVRDSINVCTSEGVLAGAESHRAFVVAVQADRGTLGWGDYTLVQSPAQADRPDACLIDHWPQPGLIPRDPERGEQIQRMGYVGYAASLSESFRDTRFQAGLKELGVEWVLREAPEQWNDFRDLDLSLAVRDIAPAWIRTKPATKLVHAWLTGCPALLGGEPAFQYWGQDGVDYFQVRTPAETLAVVQRLKQDPELYQRAREQGRSKAILHDEPAVLRQWMGVLAGVVTERFQAWKRWSTGKYASRRVQRLLTPLYKGAFCLRAKGFSVMASALTQRVRRSCACK